MLFHVEMEVLIPHDLAPSEVEELKAREKALSQELQRQGKWVHIWRVVGRYSNVSIFDVANNDELHEILQSLPLYPFMDIEVRALCRHGSSIKS